MSQENVEAFKRFTAAQNRRDVAAMLDELDPEVEWHSVIMGSLSGEATVFRGRDGVRDMLRNLYEAFDEFKVEYPEIRDLGDRLVAFGRWTSRGEASGAETAAPVAPVVDFRNGKAIRVWTYFDSQQALEAVGLRE